MLLQTRHFSLSFDKLSSNGLAAQMTRLIKAPPQLTLSVFHEHLRYCNRNNQDGDTFTLPDWPMSIYNRALTAYFRCNRRLDAFKLIGMLERHPTLQLNDNTIEHIMHDFVHNTTGVQVTRAILRLREEGRQTELEDMYRKGKRGALSVIETCRVVDDLWSMLKVPNATTWGLRLRSFCFETFAQGDIVADTPLGPTYQSQEYRHFLETSTELINKWKQFKDASTGQPNERWTMSKVLGTCLSAAMGRQCWIFAFYLVDEIRLTNLRLSSDVIQHILSYGPLPTAPSRSNRDYLLIVKEGKSANSEAPALIDENKFALTRYSKLAPLLLIRYLWAHLPDDLITPHLAERWLAYCSRMGAPLTADIALRCCKALANVMHQPWYYNGLRQCLGKGMPSDEIGDEVTYRIATQKLSLPKENVDQLWKLYEEALMNANPVI